MFNFFTRKQPPIVAVDSISSEAVPFSGKCINNHPQLKTVVGYRDDLGGFHETVEDALASNERIRKVKLRGELQKIFATYGKGAVSWQYDYVSHEIVNNPKPLLDFLNKLDNGSDTK